MMRIRFRLSLCLAAASIVFSACGGGTETASQTALAENQTLVYGKVTAAAGNDITLAVGTLEAQARADNPELEEGDIRARAASAGAPGGGPPDSGADRAEVAERNAPSGAARGRVSLTLTGETREYRIPVGTPVYLQSGANQITTNFMQIMVDNIVSLTVQTDEDGGEAVVSAAILS